MARTWVMGLAVIALGAGNLGCYYDQWVQAKRANGVLEEDLSRAKQDLADAELMNRQKDTTIDGLNKQLIAKDQTIEVLTAEKEHLRDALNQALKALEENAGNIGEVAIVPGPVLPEPLHKELMELAKQHPNVLEYVPEKGAVRWKSDLLFPLGSDQLASSGEVIEALKQFAEIVNSPAASGFDVVIVGHTCTTPIRKPETLAEHKTNWHLSAHRAISVKDLMAQLGVSETSMGVMGYGEYRPIADNSTEEGKAKNRRVEIYLVAKDSVQTVSQGVKSAYDGGLLFASADGQ